MLGALELKRRLEAGRKGEAGGLTVTPLLEDLGLLPAGSASINLRLGRWFLAVHQSRTALIDLGKERSSDEFEAAEGRMYYVPFGDKYVVHPGRFVLGATLEWVSTPETLGGFITGKSTIGRRGLVIETAAGLQPCFSGCITLELANCGEVPITLTPGMPICQIFFHEIREPSGDNKTSVGGRRKPSFGPYRLDRFLKNAVSFQKKLDESRLL